jgi:PPOX class probable F420-dependent enzyme
LRLSMERADCLARLADAEVGRLATVRPDGRPHLVPITFAVVDETLVHMVDHKPKTTQRLQRLANVAAHPHASVLVDQYGDDWEVLWWVRADGPARVVESGSEWEGARSALVTKYSQYRETPPDGPAMLITIESVSGWAASDRPR